jgi:hypothetical protein
MARRKKTVSINLPELGGGLIIADALIGGAPLASLQGGNISGALKGMADRMKSKSVQSEVIRTGVGVILVKAVAASIGQRRVGKIGPLVMRI